MTWTCCAIDEIDACSTCGAMLHGVECESATDRVHRVELTSWARGGGMAEPFCNRACILTALSNVAAVKITVPAADVEMAWPEDVRDRPGRQFG